MKYFKIILVFLFLLIFSNHNFAQFSTITTDFESSDDGWVQIPSGTNDLDWLRYSGASPHSATTGPTAAQSGNYYMYVEAQTAPSNQTSTAIIEKTFNLSGAPNPVFTMYTLTRGAGIQSITVQIYNGTDFDVLFTVPAQQTNTWDRSSICLPLQYANNSSVKIRIIATVNNSEGDAAIDNINIYSGTVSATKTDETPCYNSNNGTITVTAANSMGPYTYSTDNGGNYRSSGNFTSLNAGEYRIKAKDVFGCEIAGSLITITEPAQLKFSPTELFDVATCNGDNTGKIVMHVTGGTGQLEYSVTGSSGTFQTNNTFSTLYAGNYNLFVKDAGGCWLDGGIVVIGQPTKLVIAQISKQDVTTCYGTSTGAITIAADGGKWPLEYSIDGTNYNTQYYKSGLPAGTYTAYVKDKNGCIASQTGIQINQPTPIQLVSVDVGQITKCFGDKDGYIWITAYGGSGDLLYSIDGGLSYQSNGYFNNLIIGNYSVKLKDANNCSLTGSNVTITQPPKLIINSITPKNVLGCYGDKTGEISIVATGGTPTLYYTVDNGSSWSPNNIFTGLSAATYPVKVRDSKNCEVDVQFVSISEPQLLKYEGNTYGNVTTCYGGNNGYISIVATGGTNPLSYSINDGFTYQSAAVFSSLTVGNYKIKVKDANNCSVNGVELNLTQPTSIVIYDEQHTNVKCNGALEGTVFISASGGTGDLQYSINDGLSYYSTPRITNLPAGNYKVKVKDGNFCTVGGSSFTITEPPKLVINQEIVTDIQQCYGDATGTITILASGGTAPISYSIDQGAHFQSTNFFDFLRAGTDYNVVVQDANLCTTFGHNLTILEPSNLFIINQSHKNITTCNGGADATITVDAAGGSQPLFYSIDGGITYTQGVIPADNSAIYRGTFENLKAGFYTIKVKDSHDCYRDGFDISITEPAVMSIDSIVKTNIRCKDNNDGFIDFYAKGGKAPLYYSINDGLDFQDSYHFFGLKPGTYNLIIKDAYNCTLNAGTAILTEPEKLIINEVIKTDITGCFGDANGAINISASGGVTPLQYSVSNGVYFPNGGVFSKLFAGVYFIAVRDKNNCVETYPMITLSQPSEIKLQSYTQKNVSCFGLSDGQILLVAKGGTGVLSYSIDAGKTYINNNGLFTGLSPQTYYTSAKDENNCTVLFGNQTILEPKKVGFSAINFSNISCYGKSDGSISVEGDGGVGGYKYTINDTLTQIKNYFDNLKIGKYVVKITDANNCSASTDTFTLIMPPNSAIFEMDVREGCSPLKVNFSRVYDGTIFYDFGDGGNSSYQNVSHIFTNFAAVDMKYVVKTISISSTGCSDKYSDTVTVYRLPQLNFVLSPDTVYYPNAIVNITNNSTSGYQSYLWNFGDNSTTTQFNPVTHKYDTCGVFTVKLKANDGRCENEISHDTRVTARPPKPAFAVDIDKGCMPLTVKFTDKTTGAYSRLWDFGNGITTTDKNPTNIFEAAGVYYVKLKTTGSCLTSATTSQKIDVYQIPYANFSHEPDSVSPGQLVKFTNNSSHGRYFLWTFGDDSTSTEREPLHSYKQPGTYSVFLQVVTEMGCSDSLTITDMVHVIPVPFIKYPTAFSPNGDGVNDILLPVYEEVNEFNIVILDRLGQVVYESNDINEGWDGKNKKGEKCKTSVYVWKAFGKYNDGKLFILYGNVTLLR